MAGLFLLVLALVVSGCDCVNPAGVESLEHRPDGTVAAFVIDGYSSEGTWYARGGNGQWELSDGDRPDAPWNIEERPNPPGAAPIVGQTGNETGETCSDGWCATIASDGVTVWPAEKPDAVQNVWNRSELPGHLVTFGTECDKSHDNPQAATWMPTGGDGGEPTLIVAAARLGVITWTPSAGTNFEGLGASAMPHRFTFVAPALAQVAGLGLSFFGLVALLGTAAALSLARGTSTGRNPDGRWPDGTTIVGAVTWLPTLLFVLAVIWGALRMWGIPLMVVWVIGWTWLLVRALKNESLAAVRSWAVPAVLGSGAMVVMLGVFAVLAAYRRGGFGDGGSPFGELFWLVFWVDAAAVVFFSVRRARRNLMMSVSTSGGQLSR
jgi:hypothetical protein